MAIEDRNLAEQAALAEAEASIQSDKEAADPNADAPAATDDAPEGDK